MIVAIKLHVPPEVGAALQRRLGRADDVRSIVTHDAHALWDAFVADVMAEDHLTRGADEHPLVTALRREWGMRK